MRAHRDDIRVSDPSTMINLTTRRSQSRRLLLSNSGARKVLVPATTHAARVRHSDIHDGNGRQSRGHRQSQGSATHRERGGVDDGALSVLVTSADHRAVYVRCRAASPARPATRAGSQQRPTCSSGRRRFKRLNFNNRSPVLIWGATHPRRRRRHHPTTYGYRLLRPSP